MAIPKGTKSKQETLKKIGQGFKEYRKKVLKTTQVEIAKETGMSQSTVSFFENGKIDSLIVYLKLWGGI